MDDAPRGIDSLVKDATLSASEVGGDPTFEAGVEVGGVDCFDEESVVDRVKRFAYIDRDCRRASWGFDLVESDGDARDDRKKSSGA